MLNVIFSQQNSNGGWGESYLASVDKGWTETGVQSLQGDTPSLGDGGSGVRARSNSDANDDADHVVTRAAD